jgi:hypothetical protein
MLCGACRTVTTVQEIEAAIQVLPATEQDSLPAKRGCAVAGLRL